MEILMESKFKMKHYKDNNILITNCKFNKNSLYSTLEKTLLIKKILIAVQL